MAIVCIIDSVCVVKILNCIFGIVEIISPQFDSYINEVIVLLKKNKGKVKKWPPKLPVISNLAPQSTS